MTGNEIIKALECCIAHITDCENCSYHIVGDGDCVNKTKADAIALINRLQAKISELAEEKLALQYDLQLAKEELMTIIENQTAEIERLNAEKDNLIKTYAECQIDFLKEFVDRLEANIGDEDFYVQDKLLLMSMIDNLVKEMVGDSDES